jgi:uncharacterized protein YodC (DUF2158 family)
MSSNVATQDRTYATGDLVRALNGGPVMLVSGREPAPRGYVLLTWFTADAVLRTAAFPDCCLEPVDPSTQ